MAVSQMPAPVGLGAVEEMVQPPKSRVTPLVAMVIALPVLTLTLVVK